MICSPASPANCSTCGCSSSHSSTSGSGKCTANCLAPTTSNFRLDFFALLWYLMAIAALLFQRKVLIPDSIRVRAESRYFLFQVSTTGGTISEEFKLDIIVERKIHTETLVPFIFIGATTNENKLT